MNDQDDSRRGRTLSDSAETLPVMIVSPQRIEWADQNPLNSETRQYRYRRLPMPTYSNRPPSTGITDPAEPCRTIVPIVPSFGVPHLSTEQLRQLFDKGFLIQPMPCAIVSAHSCLRNAHPPRLSGELHAHNHRSPHATL